MILGIFDFDFSKKTAKFEKILSSAFTDKKIIFFCSEIGGIDFFVFLDTLGCDK